MSKVTYLLTLMVLFVPLAGCAGDIDATISVTGVEVVEEAENGWRYCASDDGEECHILTVDIDNKGPDDFDIGVGTYWDVVTTTGSVYEGADSVDGADSCAAGYVCTVDLYFELADGEAIEKLRWKWDYGGVDEAIV